MRYLSSSSTALVGLALLFIAAPVPAQSQVPISESDVKSLVGRISRGMAGLGILDVQSNGFVAACGPMVEPEGVLEIPFFVDGASANAGEVFANSRPRAVGSASVQDSSLFLNGSGSSARDGRSIETYTWSYRRAPDRTETLYSGGEVSTSVPLPGGSGTLYLQVTDNRGQESSSVPVPIARMTTLSAATPPPPPPVPTPAVPAAHRSIKVMSARQIDRVRSALVLYRRGGIKEIRRISIWGVRGNLLCEPPPTWKLLAGLDVLGRDIDVLARALVRVDPGNITYATRLSSVVRTSPDMNVPFAALKEMHGRPRETQFTRGQPPP